MMPAFLWIDQLLTRVIDGEYANEDQTIRWSSYRFPLNWVKEMELWKGPCRGHSFQSLLHMIAEETEAIEIERKPLTHC